ncbi:MAG: RpiB/LacA/LacB family sugar-phosphate isomerase [Patescibacteria group bacterium]|jgi:ribose 5-phosphate isomerase B
MLYLASDHAGFKLKEKIKSWLDKSNINFIDIGPFKYNELDDYPDFIIPAAKMVGKNPMKNKAIVIGYSGQGEAIAANKVKNVRAAVYYGGPLKIILLSKTHNNSNILSLGAGFLTEKQAILAISNWLGVKFTKEKRHLRRIKKITNFENKQNA